MPTLLDALPAIEEREPELTVLSYGGGQDSDAIKLKLVYDDRFRRKYAPRRLLMLMSDTSDEHAETLAHVEYTKEFCRRHGIEFHHITPDLGFHRASWQSLAAFYRRTETCGMNAGRKSCTENLKLAPLYSFLERWIADNYGTPFGKKIAFHRFRDRHGPVRMLIGIAKGEEKRVRKPRLIPLWRRACVEQRYPLIEIGYDRSLCQQFIASLGEPVPLPSNCMRCPWLSIVELLWLAGLPPLGFRRAGRDGAGEVAEVRPPRGEELRRLQGADTARNPSPRRSQLRADDRPRVAPLQDEPRSLVSANAY